MRVLIAEGSGPFSQANLNRSPDASCLRYLRRSEQRRTAKGGGGASPFVSKSRTIRSLASRARDVARVDEGKHVSQQLIWDGVRLDQLLLG